MLNRLILWLSLAGMILALHLWVQKARGFDQGCLGLDTHPATVAEGGCNDGALQASSHLFGVSNAAWGYALYFTLAFVSFAKIGAPSEWARRLHLLGEIAIVPALVYSGYLVFQMGFVAHTWCALCLGSAALIATIFALHAAVRLRGGFQPFDEPARTAEFRAAVAALFGAAGLLAGVLIFVNRLGTRPLDKGRTGAEMRRIVGDALPLYIDSAKLAQMRACHFDWDEPTLDLGEFVGPRTPFIGKPDGVPVIVFYDPNCPHCREYHAVFLRIVEKYKDRVRFTVLPRLLWDQSIPQAEALLLAEDPGKYFNLWQAMFDEQPGPWKGMSTVQIAGLFRRFGLDATDLDKRLAAMGPAVAALRNAARAAGVSVVPAVFVGGRRVWEYNRGEACMGTLIERMLSGEVAPVSGSKAH